VPKCPICETLVEDSSYTETYTSPFNNQEYKKYECPNCELHWWEPLKIIPEFYESEVFGGYIISFHEGLSLGLSALHKPFFIHFPKNVKGRLLDIGCGDGVFLKEAQKHGFEVWGIDFDSKSIETAKKSLGVDTLFAMSLEEFYEYAKKNNLTFDVITFFEVLEHQDNPKRFLEIVKELLKPGGYIAGSVPNRESYFVIERNKDPQEWVDRPPHHFLRFSKKSLEKVLHILEFNEIFVYKPNLRKDEFVPWLEHRIFKDIERFKTLFKKKILINKQTYMSTFQIESLRYKIGYSFLKFLKSLRNNIFSIALVFYITKIKGHGFNLYFHAKKLKMTD